MTTGKGLAFFLLLFISLFSMVLPRQAFAGGCGCSGIMGAACGNGGYTTCNCVCTPGDPALNQPGSCTSNYGCHQVGTGSSNGCSGSCTGCGTDFGMYNVLGTSVARTSPTTAAVSWQGDVTDECSGYAYIVGMTDPNAL